MWTAAHALISSQNRLFSVIFWVLAIDYILYKKSILVIFVYLFICKVTTKKVNVCFYKQCSQAATCLTCQQAIFVQNANEYSLEIKLFINKS